MIIGWIKNILSKIANIKLHDNSLFNTDFALKFADKMQTNVQMGCSQDNSTNIVEQKYIINVINNIDCNDSIRKAFALGNENALAVGTIVQKLLSNNNIKEAQVKEKLSNPEILSTIAEANKIAYQTSDADKRKILSELIYNKLSEQDNDISDALSLAIRAMDTLTKNQIKIIAFAYLFRSGYVKKNVLYDDFENFYNNYVIKLIDIPFEKMKDISLNLFANGAMVSLAVWAEDIDIHLPSYFEKNNGKYHQNLKISLKGMAGHLSAVWEELNLGSSFLTQYGKCIAKKYLSEILGLDITCDDNSKTKTIKPTKIVYWDEK